MGKPVSLRFGHKVGKTQDWKISSQSVPLLMKKDRERLKLVSKTANAVKKWNANFRLEYSVQKNSTIFSDVPLLPKIFRWNDSLSSRILRKLFVNGKQPVIPVRNKKTPKDSVASQLL